MLVVFMDTIRLCLLLFQSGYFAGMFTRQWKESEDRVIHIEIPDENVSIDGMYTLALFVRCWIYS